MTLPGALGVGAVGHLHLRLDQRWLDEKMSQARRDSGDLLSTQDEHAGFRVPWQRLPELSSSKLENFSS